MNKQDYITIAKNFRLCQRCTHTWKKQTKNEPKQCPKCHSPYWNKPRKRRKTPKGD